MLNFVLNEHFVELAGHLAWPVTTIILLLLTRELITQITNAITKRIEDPRSKVDLPYGITLHPASFELSTASEKLFKKINSEPAFAELLKVWLQAHNLDLSPTAFIHNKEYDKLHADAVRHFNL